jgi:predicted permease
MVLVSARTYERRGELALRRSLGAPAARVVRQLVSEGALLGTLAGILAVALGAFLCRTLAHFLPLGPGFEQLPRLEGSVAIAAVAVSAVLGALAATLPAAVIWRGASGFAGAIREAATDGRVHRLQSALVVAQVAAALTLVSGATLMTRSVAKLLNVELGLRSEDVWVANVSLATRTQAERRASYADISERIERLPGVERVGLISHLPLRDLGWAGPVRAADQPEVRDTDARLAYFRVVSPGALEALGIPVLSGRDFTAQDGESSEPVVLVNRAFADALWPGQDPIGRRIASIGFEGELWATVVGVVGEVRFDGPARDVGSVFYRPLAQVGAPTEVALVVWGSAASDALGVRLRSEIGAADPAAAVHSISTMEGVLRASIGSALRLRFFMSLLSGLALAVGSAGVFGMVSYAVSRRTREYGIRMVLGADGAQLVRSEVRRAAFTVALGGAIGVAASLPSARALDAFLFGVGPADPASFAGALALLLLVGLGAAVVPAARAGRVDPLSSLKAD